MRRIAVVVALLSSWPGLPVVGQAPSATNDVAPATVVRLPSASLAREQVATVLLPASYGSSRQRYPVVYLLHGGGQDHTAFATRGWFRSLASRDIIVVTPSRRAGANACHGRRFCRTSSV
jgi:dipeptidyl aminopeptidase/acylaminoacyl peptidase